MARQRSMVFDSHMPLRSSDLSYLDRAAAFGARAKRRMQMTGRTPNGHHLWTEKEISVLRELYPDYKAMKRRLRRRSARAIAGMCERLGIAKRVPQWTMAEISRLRKLYPTAPCDELVNEFPRRTLGAIRAAASIHGIHRKRQPYKITGHRPLDELRAHCFETGLVMGDLDYFAKSKNYFQKALWNSDWYSFAKVRRAVVALGGEFRVSWPDK